MPFGVLWLLRFVLQELSATFSELFKALVSAERFPGILTMQRVSTATHGCLDTRSHPPGVNLAVKHVKSACTAGTYTSPERLRAIYAGYCPSLSHA